MKELFRKEAADAFRAHFSTNKQLSRITVSTKLMLGVLFVGIYMYFSWMINGNIVKTAELEGVVFPAAGIKTAYVLHDGNISGVTVGVGDRVEMGDVLAVVPNNDAIGTTDYSAKMTDTDQEDDFESKKKEIDKFDYMKDSFIRSPADGYVLSILQKGRVVKEGDVFALIAADSTEFGREHVLCFLPTESKNGIKVGCDVQIVLEYAPR